MTEHRHPMSAHMYDRMEAQGYDMSSWIRTELPEPPPGTPKWLVQHHTNRAERRHGRKKSR